MKMKLVTCILVALLSMNALAQSKPKTVDEVMVLSGLKDQLSRLDITIGSKIEEKKSTFATPEQFEQFKTVMTRGLNSQNAVKHFAEYLEKYSKEDSMKLVVTFFDNPFMQEFNRIEKEAAQFAVVYSLACEVRRSVHASSGYKEVSRLPYSGN